MRNHRRPMGRLFYCLISVLWCALAVRAQGPPTTTINDVIYRADGTAAGGTLLISWPAFAVGGKAVAAGGKSVAIGPNGAVSIALAPNQDASPSGTVYKVLLKLDDGTTATEYWRVPTASPTTISAVRASLTTSGAPTQTAAATSCALSGSSDQNLCRNDSVGPNEFGSETSANFQNGLLSRVRWTTAPNSVANFAIGGFYAAPWSGGYNQTGGPKTNWQTIQALMASRTQGQHIGVNSSVYNWSSGDTQAISGIAVTNGNMNAGGDEGAVAIRADVQVGTTTFFSATVTSVSGTTINYSSPANEGTLADNLPIIILGSAYTTGSVSSISGTPPTVTGSGTVWATQFGAGAHSNLFFCADWMTASGVPYCVPVTSVTDDTHLVLGLTQQGANQAWPTGAATSGSYHLYKGGTVTQVASSLGSFTASPATDFAAGQAIQQTVGWGQIGYGAMITVKRLFPELIGGTGLGFTNTGTIPFRNALSFAGPWKRGIEFTGTMTDFGISFNNGVANAAPLIQAGGGGASDTVRLFQITDSSGTVRNFDFTRANDNWTLAGGNMGIAKDGTSLAIGTVAQPSVAGYFNASAAGRIALVASCSAANSTTCFTADFDGVPALRVNNGFLLHNNGIIDRGFSDNQGTETWRINSATGAATFTSLSGMTLGIANGGTGQTTAAAAFDALSPNTTLGDFTYRSSSGNTRLAGNTTTTRKFLRQTGDGANSAAPAWDSLLAGDIPNIAESQVTNLTTDLGAKADKVSIAGATNTKITYNAQGVVTAGAQAAFSDLSGSLTCSQHPALTGDVTTSSGSCATTIASNKLRSAVFEATGSGTCSSNTTLFLFPAGNISALTCTVTTETAGIPMPGSGTIKNLNVVLGAGGKNSDAVTIRKGAIDQSVTCTFGTGTTCSDTTHSFTVAAGDKITVKVTTSASETAANIYVTFELWN